MCERIQTLLCWQRTDYGQAFHPIGIVVADKKGKRLKVCVVSADSKGFLIVEPIAATVAR